MTVGEKIDARVERAGKAMDRVNESLDSDWKTFSLPGVGEISAPKGVFVMLIVLAVFLLLAAVL